MGARLNLSIIGAGGFVGQALVRKAKLFSGFIDVIAFKKEEFDLCRPDSWNEKLSEMDCVINSGVKIDGQTYDIFLTNTVYVRELANHMNNVGVKKFINISTGAVYGHKQIMTHPGLRCRPEGDYAVSKFLGERLFQDHFKGSLNTLRLYYPYGPAQREPRLIPRLARLINDEKLVVTNEDGGPRLSLSHVNDIATVILRDFVLEDCPEPISNIASSHQVKLIDIINKIGEQLEKEPKIRMNGNSPDFLSIPYINFEWRPFCVDKKMLESCFH